jgi:hypothetical protein
MIAQGPREKPNYTREVCVSAVEAAKQGMVLTTAQKLRVVRELVAEGKSLPVVGIRVDGELQEAFPCDLPNFLWRVEGLSLIRGAERCLETAVYLKSNYPDDLKMRRAAKLFLLDARNYQQRAQALTAQDKKDKGLIG